MEWTRLVPSMGPTQVGALILPLRDLGWSLPSPGTLFLFCQVQGGWAAP